MKCVKCNIEQDRSKFEGTRTTCTPCRVQSQKLSKERKAQSNIDESAVTQSCTSCNEEKALTQFEKTPSGGYRGVCKPCRASKRKGALLNKRQEEAKPNPEEIPKPAKCDKCEMSYPDVDFKFRTDLLRGGWRSTCNKCYNEKGYYIDYRIRERQKDEQAFLKRNAETHLKWAHENTQKVKEQKHLEKINQERKFKVILNSIRSKNKDATKNIQVRDHEKLMAKLSQRCFYCDVSPEEAEDMLNGLDRIDANGPYDDENTVSCCATCNKIKANMCVDDFLTNVRNIAMYHNSPLGNTDEKIRKRLVFGGCSNKTKVCKQEKNLTMEERVEMWFEPCYLCGRKHAFGVDRVDSMDGYSKETCQPCCSIYCNYMKCDWNLADFLNHVRNIYDFTKYWVLEDVLSKPFLNRNGSTKRLSGIFLNDELQFVVVGSHTMQDLNSLGIIRPNHKIKIVSRSLYEEFLQK